MSRMETIADAIQLHERLVDVYADAVDSTDDPELGKLMNRKLGHFYEFALDDKENAIDMDRVLSEDEYDLDALSSLDRLYVESKKWDALLGIVGRRVDLEHDGLSDLRCRLGRLTEVVGQCRWAVELHRRVLIDEPSHLESRQELERLVGHREHRRDIAKVLRPLYEDEGQWSDGCN